MRVIACLLIAVSVACSALHGQVPGILNYQGRVVVGNTNFNGTGQFKFALVNSAGNFSHWSNNGSSSAGSEPTAAVTVPVSNGLYSVLLGDTSLANMSPIPPSVFNSADVRLRVWFAVGSSEIAGGSVTFNELANGAVTTAKMGSRLAVRISYPDTVQAVQGTANGGNDRRLPMDSAHAIPGGRDQGRMTNEFNALVALRAGDYITARVSHNEAIGGIQPSGHAGGSSMLWVAPHP